MGHPDNTPGTYLMQRMPTAIPQQAARSLYPLAQGNQGEGLILSALVGDLATARLFQVTLSSKRHIPTPGGPRIMIPVSPCLSVLLVLPKLFKGPDPFLQGSRQLFRFPSPREVRLRSALSVGAPERETVSFSLSSGKPLEELSC